MQQVVVVGCKVAMDSVEIYMGDKVMGHELESNASLECYTS